jgi:hypothetical protein
MLSPRESSMTGVLAMVRLTRLPGWVWVPAVGAVCKTVRAS